MKAAKTRKTVTEVTMREFRAAPAKVLRRAARTGLSVRVGDFVLTVEDAKPKGPPPSTYGCMKGLGTILCPPEELLSANDHYSADD
jgi:hypothetical protein